MNELNQKIEKYKYRLVVANVLGNSELITKISKQIEEFEEQRNG
ncbi:MAG: hypothetical protein ACK5LC_11660 [Coprobacillaceae bacterium]